ncbi:hypothetical protein SBRY_20342 [Actinacidiphila bryophytorum]|uniref:Uncharacterized protein n=1 Tax=Actinacidiphila bryophytorum TaxID=1436133 RepID=A0A9W4GZI5_9ACTN|nr:hypothetical protein SBRY_20342 [Actinacidiphila bryophytorum]
MRSHGGISVRKQAGEAQRPPASCGGVHGRHPLARRLRAEHGCPGRRARRTPDPAAALGRRTAGTAPHGTEDGAEVEAHGERRGPDPGARPLRHRRRRRRRPAVPRWGLPLVQLAGHRGPGPGHVQPAVHGRRHPRQHRRGPRPRRAGADRQRQAGGVQRVELPELPRLDQLRLDDLQQGLRGRRRHRGRYPRHRRADFRRPPVPLPRHRQRQRAVQDAPADRLRLGRLRPAGRRGRPRR